MPTLANCRLIVVFTMSHGYKYLHCRTICQQSAPTISSSDALQISEVSVSTFSQPCCSQPYHFSTLSANWTNSLCYLRGFNSNSSSFNFIIQKWNGLPFNEKENLLLTWKIYDFLLHLVKVSVKRHISTSSICNFFCFGRNILTNGMHAAKELFQYKFLFYFQIMGWFEKSYV